MSEREQPRGADVGEESPDGVSRSKAKGRRNEVLVGIVVVLVIGALFIGMRLLEGGAILSGTYVLYADFENADGLLEGNPVKVNGLEVGSIGDLSLSEERDAVRARLEIENDVKIPQGSTASVSGFAALGEVAVAIERGPQSNPPLEEGAVLPTQQDNLLQQLQERAKPVLDNLDTTLVRAAGAFTEADALLSASRGDLQATFSHMRTASGEFSALMESERASLHNSIAHLESLTAQLDQVADDLGRFTETGSDSLTVAVNTLNAMLRQMETTLGSFERSSTHLEDVLTSINTSSGSLGRFIHDPSLYDRMDAAALNMELLLADFKENPARYLRELTLVEVF